MRGNAGAGQGGGGSVGTRLMSERGEKEQQQQYRQATFLVHLLEGGQSKSHREWMNRGRGRPFERPKLLADWPRLRDPESRSLLLKRGKRGSGVSVRSYTQTTSLDVPHKNGTVCTGQPGNMKT